MANSTDKNNGEGVFYRSESPGNVQFGADYEAQNLALIQLEELRRSSAKLMDNSVTATDSNSVPNSEREAWNEVCLLGDMKPLKSESRETQPKEEAQSSYDLLCEDDPDDFVTIEIPTDSTTTDSDAPPLQLEKKGGFLDSLRKPRSLGNTVVITGGRRRGGKGGITRPREQDYGKGLAIHELSDEQCVIQGESEAGVGSNLEKTGEKREERVNEIGKTEMNEDHRAPSEDDRLPFQSRNRLNDMSKNECHQLGDHSEEKLTARLLESHDKSHQQGMHPSQLSLTEEEKGEEFQGITAGLGFASSSNQLHTTSHSSNFDPTLCLDMLSLAMEGPEMSVRQSVHIGLAPRDIQLTKFQLPSDEEMAKEASRARIDSVGSDTREFEDEDVESSTWSEHLKHVFILSLSGKPVYSRYGKEDKLVNLFGIMQALVSFVQDDRDNLKSIVAGGHRFVFGCRGPLVFVSVAQSRQSETQLAIQLNYVYNQILSVLTHTQLTQIFEKSPGYDLRYLLQGSEKFVDNILNMIDKDPSFTFGGVRCLTMSVSLRQLITSILLQCKSKDVLFAVIVANNQVVTYIKPKEHNLVPLDIHIILNLVHSSTSFRSAESWTPICLPKFNNTGFLHAHVSYLPNDSPACMLLFSTNKEKFFDLQQCQQKIIEKLEKQGCIEPIKDAVKESNYTIDQLQAPEIRHFLYKSRKMSSVTSPKIPPVYSREEDERRLYSLYMFMHERLHSSSWPTKILYHVGNKEALLGWRTAGFDLYIVFDPLIVKAQAIILGNKLIKWISKEEDRLVITSSHTF